MHPKIGHESNSQGGSSYCADCSLVQNGVKTPVYCLKYSITTLSRLSRKPKLCPCIVHNIITTLPLSCL